MKSLIIGCATFRRGNRTTMASYIRVALRRDYHIYVGLITHCELATSCVQQKGTENRGKN